ADPRARRRGAHRSRCDRGRDQDRPGRRARSAVARAGARAALVPLRAFPLVRHGPRAWRGCDRAAAAAVVATGAAPMSENDPLLGLVDDLLALRLPDGLSGVSIEVEADGFAVSVTRHHADGASRGGVAGDDDGQAARE